MDKEPIIENREKIMKKLYLETSVVSYFVAERSESIRIAAHQRSTIAMWKGLVNHDVFVSDLVVEEVSKGNQKQVELRLVAIKDFNVLAVNDKATKLAKNLLSKNAIPVKCPEDALHIAVATVYEMEFIVTWNFKHINNPFMKNRIRAIIEEEGYKSPVICSPEDLIGVNDE